MTVRLSSRLLCVLLFAGIAVLPLGKAEAQNALGPVFRIGEFNRSSGDFAPGLPNRTVNFVVSQSDPAKDWFGVHRAVLALGKSPVPDFASAPRTITFSVDATESVDYQLHVALLLETAGVPALRVGINGKQGLFYLHPKLDYSDGNIWDNFDPAYSSVDVEFRFPASYWKPGTNTITLQPVEEADEAVPDVGVSYDAIELARVPRAAPLRDSPAEIIPTIFYQQENGQLKERIDVFVEHDRPTGGGFAELTIGAKHYRCALRGSEFGEEKLEFLVPEFPAGSRAELALLSGSKTQRFRRTVNPAKKWTLFVVPQIHVDVGFTDYQAKVAAIQARTIDEAMEMTVLHPDFRFSLDGEWDLEQFLATHSDRQKKRAIAAIQKQQIFVPAQYANLLTGIPTTETLIRSLYPSANFSRTYGTPLDYANITDVPSYSWSYASILAAAGISYFAAASDNYRAPVLLTSHLNERSPMWWEGPDGKRVLLWYSRHYMQMQMLFGMPPVLAAGRDKLPIFLQMYEKENYHANAAIVLGTQIENTDLYPQQAELARKWNHVYAYPHLQYAGLHEALANIEKQFGNDIPTIRGDGGPYWEDGAGADAYYLALERQNEARAQTAEKLATLVPFLDPSLRTDTAELGSMWKKMVLMEEHTWTSYNSVTDSTSSEAVDQLAVKDRYAVNAAADIDFITRRSMASLANTIPASSGSLIVFNGLNWKRSGLVTLDIGKDDRIVDSVSNQPIGFETLRSSPGVSHVRFLASDIPAFGYKVYKLQHRKSSGPDAHVQLPMTLEGPYYKVQLDGETGAIRSIYDKQLQRELVNQDGPYRFGQYLYVTGGDRLPNTLIHYNQISSKPDLEIHKANSGRIVSVIRTPFGQVAHLESSAENTPLIRTEIVLFDKMKKIELIEELDKKEVDTREAAYLAFPFAMKKPQFQYEIQTGVVNPEKDMYPGAGKEWFSVQHWISVQEGGASAAVFTPDTPLATLGDINRGNWPTAFGNRPGTIYSYVMNNYWDVNYRAGQGGHFKFRYAITSGEATNGADLSRMGWDEATPLEFDIITSQDKAIDPHVPEGFGGQQSLLDVDDPNVLLETWKPAEDGKGFVFRLFDFGAEERIVTVKSPLLHLAQVWQTDALERGQTPLSMQGDNQFRFTVHPHEIVTIRAVEGEQ
jgi:alpha-mannosidase